VRVAARAGGNVRFMVLLGSKSQRVKVIRQAFDDAYVERLGGGDPQTESHFFAYFGELILIKARARRLEHAAAEDVRQETFFRVLQTLRFPGGLRRAEALGAFVNSVCNNVLKERYRDQKRHQPTQEEPAPLPDTATPNAEAQLIAEERKQLVRRVIEDLSPKDRDLLLSVVMEEREKEEVCRRLGVNRDYLRVLLHRAKNQFRTLYMERQQKAGVSDRDRVKARGAAGW
jgi:RNA polymerase sigma-70 factor (ECF subfamily)